MISNHQFRAVFAALCLLGACLLANAAPKRELPVGFNSPAVDRGGPLTPDGLGWIEAITPPALSLAPRLAGGKLKVVAFVGASGVSNMYELKRRFPIDALVVAPPGAPCHQYPENFDFSSFYKLIDSGAPVDVFVMSRIDPATLPAQVQYKILQRVKDGAGLVVIDMFEKADTFSMEALVLKPIANNPEAIPGIPYDGFQQWVNTRDVIKNVMNYWHMFRGLHLDAQARPYKYGNTQISSFGKGKVYWVYTDSSWERHWDNRCLIPSIQQNRGMWLQDDYFYSLAAKAILLSSGRGQAVSISSITPHGATDGKATPSIEFTTQQPFTGTLRWQIRDQWGDISAQGKMTVSIQETGQALKLDEVKLVNAGRQYLDLWIENAAGETIDWGSAFYDVQRGVEAPEITFAYPNGAPRSADIHGNIIAKNPPEGTVARATLIDRHWREVGRQLLPLKVGQATYRFPSAGLDGQIWYVRADLLNAAGNILARNFRTVTSPHTRDSLCSFNFLMTTNNDDYAETSARREYLRRLGYATNRPYAAENPLFAEAALWNDVQLFPFVMRVDQPNNDYTTDRITDWEDPVLRQELSESIQLLTRELLPYGVRGYNTTDDCMPLDQLPVGPYTIIQFHEWLKREYGDFDGICKAWEWKPGNPPALTDELPDDPYVVVEFHDWLKKKYGTLNEVAKAWSVGMTKDNNIPDNDFGQMHTFGTIQRSMINMLRGKKNELPYNDAKTFMQEYKATNPARNPFGQITQQTIGQLWGKPAPSVDVRRFMQDRWVENMEFVKHAATVVKPDAVVGSDASFYKQSFADLAGRLDYVAPYYTDYQLRVAVSRGRMRRAGDYGACIGAYGNKPSDMSEHRRKAWDILFAGGSGLYNWMFVAGCGISDDMKLSDWHEKYICESVEELSGGISELFGKSQRIFASVAILDSQTSAICDDWEARNQAITKQPASIQGFQYGFEDLGLNPDTITTTDLSGGWLAKQGTKILALPEVNSMSDAEVAAVKAFVEAGGVLIADVRPATRYQNGNPRTTGALDEVFGITVEDKTTRKYVTGPFTAQFPGGQQIAFGINSGDARIKATTAVALGKVGEASAVFVNTFGKGKAYLLNVPIEGYTGYRNAGDKIWSAWRALIRIIGETAGERTAFPWTSNGKETPGFTVSPFRNGAGYLLGIADCGIDDWRGDRRSIEVKLTGEFYVYEIRAGKFLGKTNVLKDDLPRNGHRAYSLLPYRVDKISLKSSGKSAKIGDTVTLTVDIPGGQARNTHIVRCEAYAPDGKPFYPFQRVLRMPEKGPMKIPLTTAFNDQPGKWTFVVTDVNTGVSAVSEITLNKGGVR